MSDLVGNPEDRFSRVAAQIKTNIVLNWRAHVTKTFHVIKLKSVTDNYINHDISIDYIHDYILRG